MIPKIIHQTSKTKCLAWEERHLLARAKKIMPDYEFRLHDDSDNLKLMMEYFPEHVDKYQRISKGVAKADVARLVYMYAFGGWYCDTDYRWIIPPLQGIEEKFPEGCKCVLPVSRERDGVPTKLGNAVFGSEPKHHFWKAFIDHIFTSDELFDLKENRIEQVTGPDGLSEFYFANHNDFSGIYLPEKTMFHPTVGTLTAKVQPHTIGIHYCWAHWRTGSVKELRNKLRRKITALL